jgi:glutamate dehydrogenase
VFAPIQKTLTTSYRRIDELYLDNATPDNCYRLETFRSTGSISATASQQLRCYFVSKCNFPVNPPPSSHKDGKTDIRAVSDSMFLEKASENTLEIYQSVLWNVESRYGPVIEVFEVEGTRERRLVIGYKMGGTSHFFSALSKLYHFYSLYSARKYVGASMRVTRRQLIPEFAVRTILEWDYHHLDLPEPSP